MTRPVLVCQGFQRAFIDVPSRMFSVSASMRRSTCETVLKYARASGWSLVHSFLDTDAFGGTDGDSIDGFAPSPTEPYFRQRTLSAFGAPGFHNKLQSLLDGPIFLISFAGLGPIAATFLDAIERRFPIFVVVDAVADLSRAEVGEQDRLAAIETLVRAHNRCVRSADLVGMTDLASQPLDMIGAELGISQ
jgi:hypothetical protein